MAETLGSESRPLRVAVVGSGPTGFYVAEALFKAPESVHVDLFDRLPTPYGLVRGGVAPDHAKIKKVTVRWKKLEKRDDFRFLGNVTLGKDVTVDELKSHYDAVMVCTGAESDRRLGIPGEDLPRSHTATEFVGWYNGHPDYRDREFDLSQEVVVVIGQGNVAMDVCRILAKTEDELKSTDIAQHALDALKASKVKEIHMIGRRGPVQAKFTPVELREMGELDACDCIVDQADLELAAASREELDHVDEKARRENFNLLERFAAGEANKGHAKKLIIRFRESPKEILGEGGVERVLIEKNELSGDAFKQSSRGTGATTELESGLFFRSVGYRGVAIEGLPFHEKWGVIPHKEGRVDGMEHVYCAGWIKRGPSGVIGSNKPDAQESVRSLLEDLGGKPARDLEPVGALDEALKSRGVRVVSFADWNKLDALEIERGQAVGKPREKITRVEEMLAALD